MKPYAVLIFLLFVNATASANSQLERVDTFIESEIRKPLAKPFKDHVSLLDLNKLANVSFDSGIAYGVTVSKTVHTSYSDIRSRLQAPGGIFNVVSAVKTQRNFVKLEETANTLSLKLSIKVPIFSDFQTQDLVSLREDASGRGILEWKQIGDEGHLQYNRGAVVVESSGSSSRVTVIGVHILKQENKVPWVGRDTASTFAKTHYSNYIAALEEVLQ